MPPEGVLQQLRIPFVRRITLATSSVSEEVFMIDIGLAGAFIERAEPMAVDQTIEIHVPWPGSEIPFRASCRVAWWHSEGAPLNSKSLPPGAGLQFVDMSPADRSGNAFAPLASVLSGAIAHFLSHCGSSAAK